MDVDRLGSLMSGMGAVIAIGSIGLTILVVGVVFFVLWRVFGGLGRANAERDRLLREGVHATARILNVEMGGMTMTVGVQRHLQLRITVEVQAPDRPSYQAVLTAMVSELQIPQVQPGVIVNVRYDANNPNKIALESVGSAASSPGGPVAIPIGSSPRMSAGGKIGLVIGGCGALVGIGAAILAAVVALSVGSFGSLGRPVGSGASSPSGSDSLPMGTDVCSRAIRCCDTIGGGENCRNLGRFGVPSSACATALSGYQQAARAMGKKCS
jgi:hypothetical protein